MTTENRNDVENLSARVERIVDALAGAFSATAEAAAERLEQASQLAMLRQRLAVQSAVLELIHAQKMELLALAEKSPPALQALYHRHVEALCAQEKGILKMSGLSDEDAEKVLVHADQADQAEEEATHKRDGRRFARVNGRKEAD